MNANAAKLAICVALDVADFTIGRVPGLEVLVDLVLGAAAVMMWGWPGLFAFWEVFDPTGQVDAFVPTMTLLAISQMGRGKSDRDAD
ncbi:MAG: hypothetical protein AAGC77_02850 [Pseudomonadota bacterium]